MDPVPFAAGKVFHELLLVASLEPETAAVGPRGDLLFPEDDLLGVVADLLVDGLFAGEDIAVLVDPGHLDGRSDIDHPGIGFLDADDHLEQGGFSSPVRAHDSHHATLGKVERKILDKVLLSESLGDALENHDLVAQRNRRRDLDDVLLVLAGGHLPCNQLFILRKAGPAEVVPVRGAHLDPFQFAFERAAAGGFLLLLLGQDLHLLAEP